MDYIYKLALFLLVTCMVFTSCSKEEDDLISKKESSTSDSSNNQSNGEKDSGDKGSNDTNNVTNHTFFISSQFSTLEKPESGSFDIYFDTDAEWSVSLDLSSFEADASVSPSSGKGKSSVTVRYGPAKDKYKCSTSLTIRFRYVSKEYKNGGKEYDTKEIRILRRYEKIKP